MFTKSFVSLVFYSGKLQVLLMDNKKQTIKKHAAYDIPAGMIVNYKIQDPQKMGEFLNKVWQGLGLKQKSVAIVIPEYSTYTKSLTLPNLSASELEEAVNLRMSEFLPTGGENMIMDWEIVDRKDKEVNILAAAVQKDVLLGYVDAASRAGLLPLVVETPSLSLTRVADGQEEPKLIVYITAFETVLVVSRGHRIVATSVASSSSQQDIINTAVRMINHYRELGIKKIMLGGAGLSQSFLQALADSTAKSVEMIDLKITGMDPQQQQDFLIPISLQKKDPAQPDAVTTINLLPPMWEEHYKKQIRNSQIWTLSVVASFIIWAGFLTITVVYMLLLRQIGQIEPEVSALAGEVESETIVRVEEVNAMAQQINSVSEASVFPQVILNKISSVKPQDIVIEFWDLSLESGAVMLIGRAGSRESLVQFQTKLGEMEEFGQVTLPLRSLTNQTDFEFELNFYYEALKPAEAQKLKI